MNTNWKIFLYFGKKGYKKYRTDDFEMRAKLEQHINELVKNKASLEKIQRAYHVFHFHLLEHGIHGEESRGYMYGRDNSSLIIALFLKYIGSIRAAKINSRHRLMYIIIMSPICIATYKSVR
jgi:hypothetical protein